jgi:type II secretory pathway component PulJ
MMLTATDASTADEQRLQQLTEREAELRLKIDTLQKDIARLEVTLAGDTSHTTTQDNSHNRESSKTSTDSALTGMYLYNDDTL